MSRGLSVERTAELCARGVGLVYGVAFVSLWAQIVGLVGEDGILPVGEYLSRAREVLGIGAAVRQLPTLLWISHADAMLHSLCAFGLATSIAILSGRGSRPLLFGAWLAYLSLAVGGQTFLQFQWDSLLLETGLATLFVLPWHWRRSTVAATPGVLVLRALLCKLMLLSGVVKLASLDDLWWQLRALDVHYLTQPLPFWTSWYAHHLPRWFQTCSVFVMFLIELVLPFFMFGPRLLRRIALSGTVAFQVLIAASGNYGFFNLLTLVLCLALLDDGDLAMVRLWLRRLRRSLPQGGDDAAAPQVAEVDRRGRVGRGVAWGLAGLMVVLSVGVAMIEIQRTLRRPPRTAIARVAMTGVGAVADLFAPPLRALYPLRSINGYGLFRAMTRERPEIAIEVSSDGEVWQELRFRYKPGDPRRRPRLAGLHMPRLDWQMWFAALDPERAGWLGGLLGGILDGREPVVALLHPGALAGGQPRYVRLRMWEYRFATPEEREETGAWWVRKDRGLLSGTLTRESFR